MISSFDPSRAHVVSTVEWRSEDEAVSFRHETFMEGANDNNASVPQEEVS